MSLDPKFRKIASQLDHPRDGKIYGLQGEEFVEVGEGDVTQAGNNAFTGSNSFTTPPTSGTDATEPDELVRLGQIGGYTEQTFGEWTPAIGGISGSPTVTYAAQAGYWVKTGMLIHFRIRLQWSAVTGGSGGIRISLPIDHQGSDNVPGAGASINRVHGIEFSGQMVFSIGQSYINVRQLNADGTFEEIPVSNMESSGGTIYISGFYEDGGTLG